MSVIKDLKSDDIMQLVYKTRSGGSEVSHRIFQILPANAKRFLSDCRFETVSRWALDLLLDKYKAHRADVIADFYHAISGLSEAGSLQGHLFERLVLNHLCGMPTECTFTIRGLTDLDEMTWTYRKTKRSDDFNKITEAVEGRKPLHVVPIAHNFPAVDSIIYDPDDPDAVLTGVQITMNKEHPIAVSGLQLIQSWLKSGTPLEDLRPSNNKWWRFLFVVPLRMASTFKLQKLDGDTPTHVWAGKVKQYVLGLEEDTILRR